MKKILLILLPVFSLTACKKTEVIDPVHPPAMHYTSLEGMEISNKQSKAIDLDGNGVTDYLFTTVSVGDPLLQVDKLQFYVYSRAEAYLLFDSQDQSPILNKNDRIALEQNDYTWYGVSANLLAQEVTGMTGPSYWEGRWKDASHQYLPVQMKKNGLRYLGWIELSFPTGLEKLMLHRAALSTEPEREVKAGL